jgi:hypothetical protein
MFCTFKTAQNQWKMDFERNSQHNRNSSRKYGSSTDGKYNVLTKGGNVTEHH